MLLVDLVESVRLMREHEALHRSPMGRLRRYRRRRDMPRYRGVLVKSLGDGFMARFETVPDAVDAAAQMHRTFSAQKPASRKISIFTFAPESTLRWRGATALISTGRA